MANSIRKEVDIISVSGNRKSVHSKAYVWIGTVEQYGADLTIKEAKKFAKMLDEAIKKVEGKE